MSVLLLLIGGGAGLWLEQETITEGFAAFSGKQSPARKPGKRTSAAVPVLVAPVSEAADDVTIEAVATARAKHFITLVPEAAGKVIAFDVDAGDRVAAGDVILRLDADVAELAVEMVRVKLADAETKLARAGQLRDRNVRSKATVDDAKVILEQAKVELRQAEEELSNRILRTPFAGIVGIPKVEIGDQVTTTTPVITVDDRSEILVEIDVAERYLARMVPGQEVEARTPGYPGRSFAGRIEKIDSRIDPVSRTVHIRATLPNTQDLLRPGMSFAVELNLAGKVYPQVPELALQWGKGHSFVWRISDNKAERVTVRSVKRLNDTILVDGDLKTGDLVVVEGVQRLRPGRTVQFAGPSPAS